MWAGAEARPPARGRARRGVSAVWAGGARGGALGGGVAQSCSRAVARGPTGRARVRHPEGPPPARALAAPATLSLHIVYSPLSTLITTLPRARFEVKRSNAFL